jgi:cobaltochelatase CobS
MNIPTPSGGFITSLANRALPAVQTHNNETRKQLKTLVRELVRETFTNENRTEFATRANLTVNKAIDMVNREVLTALIGAACKSYEHNIGQHLSYEVERFADAMLYDSLCHKAKRGDGVARGWHTQAMSHEDAVHYIKNQTTTNTQTNTQGNTAMSITNYADIIIASLDVIATLEDSTLDNLHANGCTALRDKLIADMCVWAKPVDFIESEIDAIKSAVELTLEHDIDNAASMDDLDSASQEVVRTLTTRYAGNKTSAKSTGVKVDSPLQVDSTFAPALNSLLGQATNQTITDINAYIADKVADKNKIVDLEAEILRLQSSQRTVVQPVHTSGTVQVDASTLNYEVVMRKANEVFPAPDGTKSKSLDFDIVTLVWTDANGDVVQHPDCPVAEDSYQFRLRHLVKFLTAKHFSQNVWLHGHTGTGKTTLAEQIAARIGFPIERLNLDSNLERADIVGGTEIVVKDGAPTTHFREGILPRAMQQPCMFILDEIDAGRPDVLFVIQRALEGKGLTLTEDGGRTVTPHELFFFCATANSRGQGDEHGWYQGVRPMNLAMLNRFGAFIEVPYLDTDDEQRLLHKAYPALSDTEVRQMTQFAGEIRQAFTSGEISQTMSPRNLHAMAMYFLHFKPLIGNEQAMREAVQTTVVDAAPADCTHRIEEISARVF